MAGTVHKLTTFSSTMAMNPTELFSQIFRVIVTSKPAVVRRWIAFTRWKRGAKLRKGRLVVSLGVQYTHRGGAATIQLCVAKHCLIFQLARAAHSPAALTRFFSDTRINFVAIGNCREYVEMLSESHHHLRVNGLVDLRRLANSLRNCRIDASIETLASQILKLDVMVREEAVGRSDWEVERLSLEQVKYASVDAFISCLIGKELINGWLYPAV